MNLKDYEVTLHLWGSYLFCVSASDEEEAIDLAHELLDRMGDDLDLEVIHIESCQINGGHNDES
jgi:hypothetical protein